MPQSSIISVNLATIAIESMLYGIFLVLAVSALYLHLSRARSHQSSFYWVVRSAYLTPAILGSIIITLTVTGVGSISPAYPLY